MTFKKPRTLARVVRMLRRAELRPFELQHAGRTVGGFRVGAGDRLEDAARFYGRAYRSLHGPSPRIRALRFNGRVPVRQKLSGRFSVSIKTPRRVRQSRRAPRARQAQEQVRQDWAPDRGRVHFAEVPKGYALFRHELMWTSPASISAFGGDAYEHDLKLFNDTNSDAVHPFCSPWELDEFWATRSSLLWDTTFPAAAKPYFDTDDSDSCKKQDLTVGLYHPNQLAEDQEYTINLSTERGVQEESPYSVLGQKLPASCDDSPFCVGTDPFDSGSSQQMIGRGVGVAPERDRCWIAGRNSATCAKPVCGEASPLPDTYAHVVMQDQPAGFWRLCNSQPTILDPVPSASPDGPDLTNSAYTGCCVPPSAGQAGALLNNLNAAYRYNGWGTYSAAPTPMIEGPFTVEAWFRPSVSRTAGGEGFDEIVLGALQGFRLGWNDGRFVFDVVRNQQTLEATVAAAIEPLVAGRWYHLVGTYDEERATLYVDGTERSSGIGPARLGMTPHKLRVSYGDGGPADDRGRTLQGAHGDVDEVAVYRKVLMPARVAAHYEGSGR